MEVVELLVYIILVFVLLSLIGIMSWLLYDYSNLKDKLTGNFRTISNTFSSHKTKDNTLEDNINSNSSNILHTSNYVDLNALNSSNYISDVKTNLSSDLTESASNTSNYIGVVEDRADGIDTNFSTFHNLWKRLATEDKLILSKINIESWSAIDTVKELHEYFNL